MKIIDYLEHAKKNATNADPDFEKVKELLDVMRDGGLGYVVDSFFNMDHEDYNNLFSEFDRNFLKGLGEYNPGNTPLNFILNCIYGTSIQIEEIEDTDALIKV
ncbi:MAG: hypothetical protein ACRC0V_10780, partial [Fusobacteriaceae bacterium]